MTHTPGPWFVFPRGDNGLLHTGPGGHSVAYIIEVDDALANANLVKASPAMLEACKLALEYIGDRSAGSAEAWDALDDAIKQAEARPAWPR